MLLTLWWSLRDSRKPLNLTKPSHQIKHLQTQNQTRDIKIKRGNVLFVYLYCINCIRRGGSVSLVRFDLVFRWPGIFNAPRFGKCSEVLSCPSATVYHNLTCQTTDKRKVGQRRTSPKLCPQALSSLDRSCRCTRGTFFLLQPKLLSLKLGVYIKKTTAVTFLWRTLY